MNRMKLNAFALVSVLLPLVCLAQRTPSISYITQEQIKDIGGTVELECSVQYAKEYSVHWIKTGRDRSDVVFLSTGSALVLKDSRFSLRYDPSSSSYILQVKDIQETDAGIYQCQVVLSVTNKITADVELQVRRPPIISDNSTQSLVVSEGQSVQMECYASGYPPPQITWRRENNAILPTGGFTKFPCFLCHWDSRSVTNHFSKRHWDERKELKKGEHNVKELALVQADKILMPPLHIKLGLVKQFIKALDKESAAFTYILKKFPKLSDAKITAGVLTGPQVREMVMDAKFEKNLSSVQKAAWKSFKDICENFLGNHKSNNYQEIVENLVKNFGKMGCRMSLKLHILDSHLDKFKENMGAYSEEHGERFHQDIRKFESRYNKQCDEAMMGDYIWNLMTSIPGTSSKRQSSRKTIN